MNAIAPGSLRAYLAASRPRTLAAALVPVAVGAALASQRGPVRFGAVLAAFLGASLIQIGTNFANDVHDFERGADDEARIGPPRAAQSGWLSPRQLRWAVVVSFALAASVGTYLVYLEGPVLLAIGVVSILAGLAYTAGPWPLAYVGLGDVFVVVFFGLVAVLGTVKVAGASPTLTDALVATAVGALANSLLVVNNLRDREGDARVGKHTLIVRFGPRFARIEYALLVAFAYVVPVTLAARGGGLAVLAPLFTLPLAIANVRAVFVEDGAVLNARLGKTAAMLIAYGMSLAIGLAVGSRT